MAARTFGKYRLDRMIGRGSVGEVWLARDTVADRSVALKILTITAAEDPDYRRRFEREARIGASLSNPHIVPIHDFGEQDGRLFLDMAHVPGTDLARRLRPGPIGVPEAVDIVSQIAEALDAAHAAGLIHRDVKPANIIVHASGFAYLIDFGIARAPNQTTITATGFTVGTLAYMAPERFTGQADARSDIYSLACVLFECLTAQRPFGDTDPVQQLHAHLRADPPRPSADNPAIPQALDAVIARGMAKNAENRYATAGDLAAAARAAIDMLHPVPRTPPLAEQSGPATRATGQPASPWSSAPESTSALPSGIGTPGRPVRPTRAFPETPPAQANSPAQSLAPAASQGAAPGHPQPPPQGYAEPHGPSRPLPPTRAMPDSPVDAAGQPLRPTRVMPNDPAAQADPRSPVDSAGRPLRATRVMPNDPVDGAGQSAHSTRVMPDEQVDSAGRPLRPTRVMPGPGGGRAPWRPGGAGGGTARQPVRPEPRQRSVVKIATVVVGVAVLGFALVAACTAVLTQGGGGQPGRQPAGSVTATAEPRASTAPPTGKDWPPPGYTLPFPTEFPTSFQFPIPTLQFPAPQSHKPNKEDKKQER
ncbi:serine/threonine-protein kinase [Nocardia wallacei]|uniref:serine/threonine-protein kinase n=1 Tax=Nocardia wallacei TaxID=480035 RepID=UPI002458ECBC|nr:serine/threonine-protein kinase [Nocardia wallacei]